MMKAVILDSPGDVSHLKLTEIPVPEINNDEVLVQVKAISINPVDAKTRSGKGLYGSLKDQNPLIPGWDISGVVIKTGKNVKDFTNGNEVFGMVNFPGHGKAYAEYVAAPAEHLALKPPSVSHNEAAAASLAAITAWQAFTVHTKINKGNRVLIHAASGGVGHFAV
ncbi:MAG: NADP-dependent oxidoreductase, partial [Ignavibacteriaceae bacterium]